jgi:hypothetical protein
VWTAARGTPPAPGARAVSTDVDGTVWRAVRVRAANAND